MKKALLKIGGFICLLLVVIGLRLYANSKYCEKPTIENKNYQETTYAINANQKDCF